MAANRLRSREEKALPSCSLDVGATDDADEGFVLVDDTSDLTLDDFEILEAHTPYSMPLSQIDYDEKDQGLKNSSHRVIYGIDPKDDSRHYLKFNDNEAMLYCESFMSNLYNLSLLYGVTRCYVRYDDMDKPVAVSSREIPDFATFKYKDAKLTQELMDDPFYRKRFTQILAVFFRLHEDDGHRGNITTKLEIFDADCAFWDVTYKIKGGRPNVDNVLGGVISRDPAKAFQLNEYDIQHFPNIIHSKPWYFPSLDAVATAFFSDNPFSPSETEVVRKLESHPETLSICFTEFLDWMLDMSQRFKPLAQLSIPRKLSISDENVIDMYCAKNAAINSEYWDILPQMPVFQEFLKKNSERVLHEILVRCLVRNARLRAEMELYPGRSALISRAIIEPASVIALYNQLAHTIKRLELMTFSLINYSMFESIFVRSDGVSILINETKEKELIGSAQSTAMILVNTEAEYGPGCWEKFMQIPASRFDDKHESVKHESVKHESVKPESVMRMGR